MRTSLNEIKQIEDYLHGNATCEEELLFEVKQLINAPFAIQVAAQKDSYRLIEAYGRKVLRQQIESVHQQLFNEKEHNGFKEMILSFFKKG